MEFNSAKCIDILTVLFGAVLVWEYGVLQISPELPTSFALWKTHRFLIRTFWVENIEFRSMGKPIDFGNLEFRSMEVP